MDRIVKIVSHVASGILAAAVVLMAVQVVLRFGFNSPQAWAEEVDRYLFVWSVYLGSVVALSKGTHIRVTFLVDLGGPRVDRLVQVVGTIVCLVSFTFVGYYGVKLAYANRNASFYTLEALPLVVFYLAIPVGMTLMVLWLLWPKKNLKAPSQR